MGNLWFDGANYASDVMLLKEKDGQKCMLAIKRKTGEWAMPGGFRERSHVEGESYDTDEIEDAGHAAWRELFEETNIHVTHDFRCSAELVYEGPVMDPRNTKDRWVETSVFLIDLGTLNDTFMEPKAGDDAQDVCWLPLTTENIAALYAGHSEIVAKVMAARGMYICAPCVQSMLIEFALDGQTGPASLMTKIINSVMRFSVETVDRHASRNPLIRLRVLLRVVQTTVAFILSRLDHRLGPITVEQSEHHFLTFKKNYMAKVSAEDFDRLMEEFLTASKPLPKGGHVVRGPSELN